MKLNDVREGNYVEESKYSSRDRSNEPFYRVKYDDLEYHNYMEGIPITLEWCKRLKMDIEERIHPSGNYDWIAEAGGLRVVGDKGKIFISHGNMGCRTSLEHIKYVHQLQNFYYGYWGTEIDEPPSEFYSKPFNK